MVGAFEEEVYVDKSLQLDHGDTLVLFTDGVTEATDSTNRPFGTERLDNILSGVADKSSREIVEAIKAGITDFVEDAEQTDDITILALKRK